MKILFKNKREFEDIDVKSVKRDNIKWKCIQIMILEKDKDTSFINSKAGHYKYTNLEKLLIFDETMNRIRSHCFYDCANLRIVKLPDSLVCICACAFSGCLNLEYINLPPSLKRIKEFAFLECVSLRSIKLPQKIDIINEGAFKLSGLRGNIEIPNNCTWVGNNAFEYTQIRSVTFQDRKQDPASYLHVGNSAFGECSLLEFAKLPNNLITIPEYCFNNCISLVDVKIPKDVHAIEKFAFRNTKIFKLEILENVGLIGCCAFSLCKCLEKVIIKSRFLSIDQEAFRSCINLKEVTFENDTMMSKISESVFCDCRNLMKIKLPNNIRKISEYAFQNCSKLEEVVLSSNLHLIERYAFSNCCSLRKIVIPKNTCVINYGAFHKCTNLETVIIENQDIKRDGLLKDVFVDCDNLKELLVLEGNKYINLLNKT